MTILFVVKGEYWGGGEAGLWEWIAGVYSTQLDADMALAEAERNHTRYDFSISAVEFGKYIAPAWEC